MLSRNYAFTVCACAFLLLGAHASAQIQVQSPGSTSSVPVHLQASVSSCNGDSIAGLSYSRRQQSLLHHESKRPGQRL